MLKRFFKSSIIVLIQFVTLGILVAIVSSIFLNHTKLLNQWHGFFSQFKLAFLLYHTLFYAALFLFWPWLIAIYVRHQPQKPNAIQVAKAMHMRIYLVGVLVLFECLTLLR